MTTNSQYAITQAEHGKTFIRLATPIVTFRISLIIAAAGIAVLWFIPLRFAEQFVGTDGVILIYGIALATSFILLFIAQNLPLWNIVRNNYNEYGNNEPGVEELKTHYYVYRMAEWTFTLKRSKDNLTLTSRFFKSLPLNLWMLAVALIAYLDTHSHVREHTSNHARMEAAAYDTLQARQFNVKGVEFTMIYVQGGHYTMGATRNQGFNWKQGEEEGRNPLATVTVSNFYIGRTEVTNELWDAVMDTTSGEGQNPKADITWYDSQEFINRLNTLTGEQFRLPTCAEWEWAARGGVKSHGYRYSGSNNIDSVAYYGVHAVPKEVAAKKWANELGIFDMSGNVEEWMLDAHSNPAWRDGMKDPVLDVPLFTSYEDDGLTMGGAYDSDEIYCRTSVTRARKRAEKDNGVGLRLVLSPDTEYSLMKLNEVSTVAYRSSFAVTLTPQPNETLAERIERENGHNLPETKIIEQTIPLGDIDIKMEVEVDALNSYLNAGQAIDLGLSVKWCSSNVGADTGLAYGNYYTWYEAQNLKEKGGWRPPTDKEQRELVRRCQWQRITINNSDGYIVTAPNGNRIFLPSAGYYKKGEAHQQGTHGYYWSGCTMEGFPDDAIQLYFTNQEISPPRQNFRNRQDALPVRLVKK